jgi:death on curing protein
MKEPVWITPREALGLHDLQLVTFGGPAGLRDLGLLESALARPRNVLVYEQPGSKSLARLAAAYAFGIVSNHPFIDGNKRTGLVVSFAFLDRNGVDVTATEEDVYRAFVDLAAGRMKETDFTRWLEANTAAREG